MKRKVKLHKQKPETTVTSIRAETRVLKGLRKRKVNISNACAKHLLDLYKDMVADEYMDQAEKENAKEGSKNLLQNPKSVKYKSF